MEVIYKITKEDLYKMYIEKQISTKEIAKIYGCNTNTVRYRLNVFNIPMRQKNGLFQEPYYIDGDFFKTWSHNMAWVVGYITADGCVRKNKYEVKIKSIDYEMLEFVRQNLSTNYQIKKEKGSNCYSISIYSKNIIDDLYKLGITDKKSLTIHLPSIPKEYFWSFLRGLIDGDGHILPPFGKPKRIGFQITGSYFILNSIMDILWKKFKMPRYKLNPQGKAACLQIHGLWAYKIIDKVYNNSYYGLSRKKEMALKVMKVFEDKMKCIDCGEIMIFAHDVGARKCKKCSCNRKTR
jgi:hypothetical protein